MLLQQPLTERDDLLHPGLQIEVNGVQVTPHHLLTCPAEYVSELVRHCPIYVMLRGTLRQFRASLMGGRRVGAKSGGHSILGWRSAHCLANVPPSFMFARCYRAAAQERFQTASNKQ
jgi:hypothetical protein